MKISQMLRRAITDMLDQYKLTSLVKGAPTILYHGTTKTFNKFDMTKSRVNLVNTYYGVGLFFSPSKKVAWRYADANRNIGFEPEIIDDMKKVNRNAGDFLEQLVKKGVDAWTDLFADLKKAYPDQEAWEIIPEYFQGIDPNTLDDFASYVLGSQTRPLEDNGPVNIFSVRTGLPDHIYDSLDEAGLDSKKYRPKVYTVTATANKVLVTPSKSQARSARRKGYDAVIYYGSDLVGGIPEVALFDASHIRITHVEVGD